MDESEENATNTNIDSDLTPLFNKALQDAIESGLMDSVIDGEKSSLSSKRKGDKGGEDENRVFRIIQRAPGNLVCADCPNESMSLGPMSKL